MKLLRDLKTALFSPHNSAQTEFSDKERERVVAKKAEHFPFDFDRWYKPLAPFSFHSEILSISPQTAQSMVNYYQKRYLNRDVLTTEDIHNLEALKDDIQKRIDKIRALGRTQNVFVRMSNRSPKDGSPLLKPGESLFSMYKTILDDPNIKTLNDKMIIICDLQMKVLNCPDSDHVMNLLLTSERIYTDLLLALDCHKMDNKDDWSTSVILREWEQNLTQDFEFRVFVYKDKVTAISQYNPYCLYDSLTTLANSKERDKLIANIETFVRQLKPHLMHQNFVIDLALIEGALKVVELNPFISSTGGCLFSWQSNHDVLMGQNDKPIFRVRDQELPDLQNVINITCNSEEMLSQSNREPYYLLLENRNGSSLHK